MTKMKSKTGLAILLVVLSLVVGGIVGAMMFSTQTTITKEVPKDVLVEKLVMVNQTVEVEVSPDYKQEVVSALFDEAATDKALRMCGGDKYDIDEISVKKVYDGFSLTENSDGDLSISDIKVKLNFDDGKCYNTLTCGLDADLEISC